MTPAAIVLPPSLRANFKPIIIKWIPYSTCKGYESLTLISRLSPGIAIFPSSAKITSTATSAVLI